MTKTVKRYRVNAVIQVNFPMYVLAESEDEAIEKCEESFGDYSLEVYSDTVGVDVPSDDMDDDDCTAVFEMGEYEAESWSDFEFSIDDYTTPEEVELEYDGDDDEEDEDDDDEEEDEE